MQISIFVLMAKPFQRIDFKLGEETVIGRAVFSPPFKAGEDMVNEARFVFVVKGYSKLNVPKGQAIVKTGDSFLMKSESFINQHYENDDGSQSEVIIIRIIPEVLTQIYGQNLPAVFTSNFQETDPIEVVKKNEMIDLYIQSLRQYFDHQEMVSEEVIRLKVRELIQLLVSLDNSGNIHRILGSLFIKNNYALTEVVEANLYEDLQLPDLAHLAGLSLSSFKRKFKEVFGQSPNQYIIGRRVERAKFLLQSSTFNVSEIAYDVGFNDLSHFSKTFHNLVGLSPSEYRSSA